VSYSNITVRAPKVSYIEKQKDTGRVPPENPAREGLIRARGKQGIAKKKMTSSFHKNRKKGSGDSLELTQETDHTPVPSNNVPLQGREILRSQDVKKRGVVTERYIFWVPGKRTWISSSQ